MPDAREQIVQMLEDFRRVERDAALDEACDGLYARFRSDSNFDDIVSAIRAMKSQP